jgi:AcrR family transcriptional regulator
MPQKKNQPRTLPPEERRRQIVDAVLRVVSEHGVPNTTVSRVAQTAGVAQGTPYFHFRDRTEMLIAALDSIFADMRRLVAVHGETNQLERLREGGRRHTETMATEKGGFAYAWVEFIAAPAEMGLRDAVAETQRAAFRILRDIAEAGKAQGTIRADADAEQIAWEWLMFAWAENIACLMGLDEFFEQKRSQPLFELILANVATGDEPVPRTAAEAERNGEFRDSRR